MALDGSTDVCQAFAEDLCHIVLLAVHKLDFTAICLQVNHHIIEIPQINDAVEIDRTVVGTRECVIIESDDIVLNRNASSCESERTAVTGQINSC